MNMEIVIYLENDPLNDKFHLKWIFFFRRAHDQFLPMTVFKQSCIMDVREFVSSEVIQVWGITLCKSHITIVFDDCLWLMPSFPFILD